MTPRPPSQAEVTTAPPARERMTLVEFKPVVRNTLRGFCILDIPPGIIVYDVSVHEKNGKRWASLPSKPVLDSEGRHVVTHSGQKQYAALLAARVVALVLEHDPGAFDRDRPRAPRRSPKRRTLMWPRSKRAR